MSNLLSALLASIHVTIPWDDLRALPGDVVEALSTGDTTALRSHVAATLDDTVDLSGLPIVGPAAEKVTDAAIADLVSHVTSQIATGAVTPLPGGASRALAVKVVSDLEEAQAVLAMGPIWRATHPVLVHAARAIVGA